MKKLTKDDLIKLAQTSPEDLDNLIGIAKYGVRSADGFQYFGAGFNDNDTRLVETVLKELKININNKKEETCQKK